MRSNRGYFIGTSSNLYWSSTEYYVTNARVIRFSSTSNSEISSKTNTNYVRAVRAFLIIKRLMNAGFIPRLIFSTFL